MKYPVVVIPLSDEEGGGYVAMAMDLRGCVSDGQTPEEAIDNVRFAIDEWIDHARELEREIPQPHSGMEAARKERNDLINAVREFARIAEQYTDIDQRLCDLEREIEELAARSENERAWSRFSSITGEQPARVQRTGSRKALC